MRRTSLERACLKHIEFARLGVPSYGRGEGITPAEVQRLRDVFNLIVQPADIGVPILTSPPVAGTHYSFVRPDLPRAIVDYLSLHEVSHILAGEATELTWVTFNGPLPEMEDRCDVFALTGLLDEADVRLGAEHVEGAIRELVPLEVPGWQTKRIPRLAPQVVRMRSLIDEWLDA